MIYFVDNNGTVIDTLTTPVNQGSVDTNNIYLIAPFASNLQFAVAFQLPNGLYTERYVMTPVGEIPNVQYAPTNKPYSIWSFTMPNDITQYYGTVYAQFYAYGTNGQITATSRTSFVVAAGVPEQLPSTPTQDVYNQILTALSQYSSQLNSGAYAARSIYWWINTFTYGMNEITFYPVGTYGAFVKSLVTNNTGNQPYNSDGVLNSEYWAELANLNSIFDEAVNAQGSAAAAAASAQQAAQSASAASSSSSSAQQSATNAAASANSAAGSATTAQQSASAAASSAQSALTSANNAAGSATTAQNAAQELTDNLNKTTVFVDALPVTGDSQYLYFVAGADNNLFNIYTWDGAWQLLGSANLVVNNTKTYNLTLLSTAWSDNQQTLTVDGISDADNVNIYPAEGYSDEYINYGIQAVSTSSNGVTFSCKSVPSENISVVVSVDTEVAIPTANGYYTQSQSNTLFASTGTLTMDPSTFIITMTLKSISGATLVTQSIDLPVESMVVGATYDSGTKSIILTLQNGNTVSVPVGDLVNGLATTAQLNAETSAREAADTNLQNQITNIKNGTTVVGAAESITGIRLTNEDLNNLYGSEYWGKVFYAVGSNTVANKPPEAVGFNLEVKQGGNNTTIQILRARNQTTSSNVPTTWQRAMDTVAGGGWSNWEELMTSDGSYSKAKVGALTLAAAVGSSAQPVYFNADGVPVACGDSLDVSVTGNAGGVTATQLTTEDLNTLYGSNCWGKTFYGASGNTVTNKPAGVQWFSLEILRGAGGATIQRLTYSQYSDNDSNPPTIYQRCDNTSNGSNWSAWEELVTADGSYPTLGAGYLSRSIFVGNQNNNGWYKFATWTPSGTAAQLVSTIFLVNGVNASNIENSGHIQLDSYIGANAATAEIQNFNAMDGNINLSAFCAVVNGKNIDLYTNLQPYRSYNITIIDECDNNGNQVNEIQLSNTFYSSSAPSGAVYAVNRNNAAQVENALTLVAGATTETYNGSEAVTFNVTAQAGQAVYQSISIPTSAWSGNSATVTVSGATSSAYIEASAADTASAAQVVNNNIVATAAGTNTVTFTADSTPTATVNMNILIIY